MKILHLASFTGNIGDNASHFGLRKILDNFFLVKSADIQRIEIRRFYKNYSLSDKLFFNEDFVRLVNDYDLLLIGGGGFLDYWVENSQTGTTIDINPILLQKIKTPILFSSIGALPHKEIPVGNIEKFKNFLALAYQEKNIAFALRNDGSIDNIAHVLGSNYSQEMYSVCDNAFFYETPELELNIEEKPYVLINTTQDQLLMKNKSIGEIDSNTYVQSMIGFVNYLIEQTELIIVFVPHIYGDLHAIQKISDNINDFKRRTRIRIAPYLSEDLGTHKLFSLYKNSEFNVGMRFHANVCSLSLNTLSVGLAALDRVVNMYQSVGLDNGSYVSVDHDFTNELITKVKAMQNNKDEMLAKRAQLINKTRNETLRIYEDIFSRLI